MDSLGFCNAWLSFPETMKTLVRLSASEAEEILKEVEQECKDKGLLCKVINT